MSVVTVQSSCNVAGSVDYLLYGRFKERQLHIDPGRTRAAAMAISIADGGGTPAEFVERAQALARRHGRKVEAYSYVQSFHPDEFDVASQEDLEKVRDVAVQLVKRMHSADYCIVVHADAAGGHAHAHILVTNHDNLTGKSLQRYTSWRHGLHQLNDELMRDMELAVLPDPTEPKPDWELRRETFTAGGFEQVLGDKVYLALADPRSVDQAAFTHVLAEHGVTLAVTHRDGWSYKMRRDDNGKLGRKKASTLTPEFTAEGAEKIFNFHKNKEQMYGTSQQLSTSRHARTDYGDLGDLELSPVRRRATSQKADEDGQETSGSRENDERNSRDRSGEAEGVDLAVARAALDAIAPRRGNRKTERDRKDTRQRRQAAQRQRSREATRRVQREALRSGRLHDDAPAQRPNRTDDLSFG